VRNEFAPTLLEVFLICQKPLFLKGPKQAYCYRPFTAIKQYFYWALKSPLRKSGFCHIRNTSTLLDWM
jgi:hypothetical protein